MKTQEYPLPDERDEDMVQNPHKWPRYPILPLKRSMKETAMLRYQAVNDSYQIQITRWDAKIVISEWKEITVNEVIGDGWRVD